MKTDCIVKTKWICNLATALAIVLLALAFAGCGNTAGGSYVTGAGSSGGYGSGDSNGDEQQSPDGSGESGDLTKATYTWDENTKTITFTGPG